METETPTILWRMFRPGRENARAVILPGGPPFTIAFFANDAMDRVENYDDLDLVMFRAQETRRSLEADGWVADESAEERRQKSEERKRQTL